MNKAKVASIRTKKADRTHRQRGHKANGMRGNGTNGEGNKVLRAARAEHRDLEIAVERYQDLYEFAPVGYVTFNRTGRIEQANLRACELLAIKREHLVGSPFSRFVLKDDIRLYLNHLVRCRSGEHHVESNLRLRKRAGEPVSVFLSSVATSNSIADGAFVYQTAIVDLTERERAEEALRTKEAELERIVTQTPFMLTRCTRDLRYRYVSNAYAKMIGSTSEEIAGKPVVQIMGKEGLATIRPYINRVLNGETVSYETVVPFFKESHYLHAVYVPDKDSRGEIVGWIASLIDITERKRAEEAVMRLATVVQSSHDAIVAKDLNGIITDWNQSAERIFGYSAKDIIGKSVRTLIPQDRQNEEEEILRKVRSGESIDHYETVRCRKDGRLLDVALTISPMKDAQGRIVGASKIAHDITAQKRAERRLIEQARLLDLSNEAILVRDRQERIAYWNQGAEELYGYDANEALGKVTHRLLQTEHPERFDEIFKNLERDGRWSGELVHKRKDGTKIIVMSHWALDRDENGRRACVLETNSDITQRKRAELALERSKEMLEELVRQRTKALRFANAELQTEIARRRGLEGQILEISDREQERLGQELHDGLCQQLTAIGFLARATALRLKDHRVVQVDELEKIAQLINSSVMDARNIARDLHKEEINAAEFLSALRDLVHRKIWKTPCRLNLKTKIHIESDMVASQLYRILREAIINANKHAQATLIVLEVRRQKNELVFTVRDNGVGFTRKTKGAGLGFHIMKYRAESIGARLELDSLKKGGARVVCHLPIAITE